MGSDEKLPTGVVSNAWSLKIPEFKPEDNPRGLIEESSFSTLFPKYREAYLVECWGLVEKILSAHRLVAELDVREGTMTVKTTRKTWDPYIIIKARDMIKLLSRGVPINEAQKVLEDENGSDIIKIGSMVRNKEKFVKRRQRLLGSGGCTLKSLEILSGCYIHVQGQTVAVVGPYRGLIQARRVIEDTMKNVHPYYSIKVLMIKRELAKDENLKNENWSRFLPKFESKKTGANKKKKIKEKKKKPYTPFPPPQQEREIDKLMASGEYFMTEAEKKKKKKAEIMKREAEAKVRRDLKRKEAFVPPTEGPVTNKRPANDADVDIKQLKKKIKKHKFN